eukprot:CAMPEP_0181221318 /NCGR_PEP_ID=MMETSP1096-20121128/29329_1 /TAXON_ID=156174 ORGANISM="Chrysochromulina ericina, Strain CCMP281" /NCGR_SAMPLE_ID=MMETSP1096 /ASSEMBLY_ACC=CAM_ASM_000453 /LENGTH=96 /DNA_ID=CAMNT_0023313925 /DNA_START=235 /DNA_END=525 /DNA_ORIENTATION=+
MAEVHDSLARLATVQLHQPAYCSGGRSTARMSATTRRVRTNERPSATGADAEACARAEAKSRVDSIARRISGMRAGEWVAQRARAASIELSSGRRK